MANTTGTSSGGSGSFNTSFTDISQGLFGTDASKKGTTTTDETITEQLKIDKEGVLSLIEGILSGTEGLAQIFGQEQAAGIFGGSEAKAGTENLLAKIAGELAKVTAQKVSTKKGTTVAGEEATGKGILDRLGLEGLSGSDALTLVSPTSGGTVNAFKKNSPF